MIKVLVTGKNGQLGNELQKTSEGFPSIKALFTDADSLDICDEYAVNEALAELQPDIVINAAAYTAVDKAEDEVESCYQVNEVGPKYLANACHKVGAKLVQVSTDFVFDGAKNTPYCVDDIANPLSIYGKSKLAGEEAVKKILPNSHAIIRTAWVYSEHGNNFVKTMLRLMREKEQLSVVNDQIGTPTWANGLAKIIWTLCVNNQKISGKTYHWTDAGVASWYDFAVAIQEKAIALGILAKKIPINGIPATDYPTPAKRPPFSVLDKSSVEKGLGEEITHWQTQLRRMLKEMSSGS